MVQRAHGGYRTSEGPESCMLVLGMLCLSAYAVQCAIAVVSPVSSNSGKPRVFVYDLPANITDGVPTQDDRQGDELASGSPNLLDCLFGTEFTVQTALGPLKLRKTDQHAIGRIFLWRIMGSANKVEHPNEADLFFVPIWYSDSFPTPTTCPTSVEMLGQLHHLDANTVGKHIFVSPRVAHDGDVCPFWWGHPWHRGLPINQVDCSAPVNEKLAAGHMNAIMKFALEDRDCCWRVVGENTHSIPYAGFGSGLGLNMTRKLGQLREPSRSRPILLMGVFEDFPTKLALECKFIGPPICMGVVLKEDKKDGHALVLSDSTFTELVTAMLRSRFCVQPTGDNPSRKGIVDSILLGCIPVLFSRNQTRLWPWHLPNLRNITVMLDITEGSAIDQLKAIDEARVTQLRKGVVEAAKSLAYAIQDGTGDAVEATLYHAWIHSGGGPEERQVTPGPTVRSSSTPLAQKEHSSVLAFDDEVAKEKLPEHRAWWSDHWMGTVVCVCSILPWCSFLVLSTCPKQSESNGLLDGH